MECIAGSGAENARYSKLRIKNGRDGLTTQLRTKSYFNIYDKLDENVSVPQKHIGMAAGITMHTSKWQAICVERDLLPVKSFQITTGKGQHPTAEVAINVRRVEIRSI